eukprot:gene2085-18140_t
MSNVLVPINSSGESEAAAISTANAERQVASEISQPVTGNIVKSQQVNTTRSVEILQEFRETQPQGPPQSQAPPQGMQTLQTTVLHIADSNVGINTSPQGGLYENQCYIQAKAAGASAAPQASASQQGGLHENQCYIQAKTAGASTAPQASASPRGGLYENQCYTQAKAAGASTAPQASASGVREVDSFLHEISAGGASPGGARAQEVLHLEAHVHSNGSFLHKLFAAWASDGGAKAQTLSTFLEWGGQQSAEDNPVYILQSRDESPKQFSVADMFHNPLFHSAQKN